MVWKVIHNIGIKLIYLWLKGKEMKTEGKGLFSPALQPLKDEGRGNPWKERCNTRE